MATACSEGVQAWYAEGTGIAGEQSTMQLMVAGWKKNFVCKASGSGRMRVTQIVF
jgi:hypothetical protein